jgi:peptidoglycan/LPS O-acetylase OafA/YrhL
LAAAEPCLKAGRHAGTVVVIDTAVEAPAAHIRRAARPRLTHVDAMRPVKQLGVVSTHSLQSFAPAASVGVGAGLMLTHVTRFAFMFISAAMLVYAYPAVGRGGWRTFWRRRLLAVVLPYATWTVIYFALGLAQAGRTASIGGDAGHLGWLLLTGYDQLYFLVVLLQFYLIYPAFLWLIRRTERHHWQLLGASLAVELVLAWLVHEQYVPSWMLNQAATRELWNYQLFVIAGAVMAWRYDDVHRWLIRHWRALLAAAAAAIAFGEAWYLLAAHGVPGFRGADPSDPFQPAEIPLYLGLITVVYLLGVVMDGERRPRWLRSLARAGADYSYGIYLSQVLFLTALTTSGWQSLDHYLPWGLVTAGGIVIVFAGAALLTALLARLPGARATAGIPRRPWRAEPGAASHQDRNGGPHGRD